jgi:hypothetical protein
MALRQTLLTTLISTDQDAESYPSQFDNVIVDLTDPILSATKLDATIFNILLREFVTTGPQEPRVIGETGCMVNGTATKSVSVINNAQEFLRSDSSLSKSILSLITTGDGSHSVLLTALNLLSIEPSFISLSDYVMRGYPNPRSWTEYYQLHAPSGSFGCQEPPIYAGQVIITPRDLITIGQATKSNSSISESIVMDVQEFKTKGLFPPLQITDPKREGHVLDIDLEDDLKMEPSRGVPSYDRLTNAQTSPISTFILGKTEISISVSSNSAEDNDRTFFVDSHIVNGLDPFELYPHPAIPEPTGNIDRNSLLLLVLNLINNRAKVCTSSVIPKYH